ncbi:MAG: hypothetical protein HY057_12870, partial [Rhodospirillales bacterium]|nr:hypothetical protein [Rhodospirillales bacterium]
VKNFSFPNHVVRIGERIFFSQDDDVAVVQALLDRALTAAPGLAVLPPPNVLYRGTLDGVSEFAMRYYIADYKDKDSATESVWRSVIDHVKRSPHRIITPRRQIELIQDLPADAVAAFVRK